LQVQLQYAVADLCLTHHRMWPYVYRALLGVEAANSLTYTLCRLTTSTIRSVAELCSGSWRPPIYHTSSISMRKACFVQQLLTLIRQLTSWQHSGPTSTEVSIYEQKKQAHYVEFMRASL